MAAGTEPILSSKQERTCEALDAIYGRIAEANASLGHTSTRQEVVDSINEASLAERRAIGRTFRTEEFPEEYKLAKSASASGDSKFRVLGGQLHLTMEDARNRAKLGMGEEFANSLTHRRLIFAKINERCVGLGYVFVFDAPAPS